MLRCNLADIAPDERDLCGKHWAWGLAAAWLTSPLFAFAVFVTMRRLNAAMQSWREPFILNPTSRNSEVYKGAASLRVCALNMCLLPGGVSFSGSWLFDGDDKKKERIDMLLSFLDDYDVILLNEMWGCWWSSYHLDFFKGAADRGFYICATPVGLVMDSGNIIVSRFPLTNASSCTFQNASGWQSLIPNGILHVICNLPSGARIHCFTTHLQCTSAPSEGMRIKEPVDSDDERDEGCLSGMVRVFGDADQGREAEQRLQQLHELSRFVFATAGMDGQYIVGGDLNIEGGSEDYLEAVKLFGRDSINAPDFKPTYTTRSFLTPPGWRTVLWESNLDHIFSNMDVQEFEVLSVDMSDHLPLHLVVSQPRPSEVNAGFGAKSVMAECSRSVLSRDKLHMKTQQPGANKPVDRSGLSVSVPLILEQMIPLMFEDLPMTP